MHGIFPSARLKPSPYYQATVAEGELRCEVTETKDARNGMKQR